MSQNNPSDLRRLFISDSETESDNGESGHAPIVRDSPIHEDNPKERDNPSELSFTASTTQITHLAEVFQSLITINNLAIISIKPTMITIYSTYNHNFNVHVTIERSLFSSYNFTSANPEDKLDDAEITLGVDINLITECFVSVVNTLKYEKSVSCDFNYQGEGSPLIIEFEDNNMTEKLEFYTFHLDNADLISDTNVRIDYTSLCFDFRVMPDVLTNLLQDLNQISTERLFIYVAEKTLNFISNGPIGTSKLIFPNDSTTPGDFKFTPGKNYDILQFEFENFFKVFKSVRMSSQCKIIKDSNGCFSIQLLCKNVPLASYPGTLITINMLEVDHDEFMIGWILNDSQEEKELENSLHPRQVGREEKESYSTLLPTTSTEPLINSFRKPQYVEVPATMEASERPQPTASKKRKRTEEVRNVGGAVEVPLFL
ncbi:DNA damage checkpoint control protein RAD17 [Candida viswanathii]|uniref:DNA damage checkpoint control protein RAD17 n=1 Tax=Candida viswanathii TaxID=5486 RepID=A0A367Y375_9ASCO|nr:DNA damage checkpoint control protein RAD17 [Candida viswanathii]